MGAAVVIFCWDYYQPEKCNFTACCTTEWRSSIINLHALNPKIEKCKLNGGPTCKFEAINWILTASHDLTFASANVTEYNWNKGGVSTKPYISWLLRMSVSQLVDTDSGVSKSRSKKSHQSSAISHLLSTTPSRRTWRTWRRTWTWRTWLSTSRRTWRRTWLSTNRRTSRRTSY